MGFWNFFKKIAWPFVQIAKLFSSQAAKNIFKLIDELVPQVAPIVASIMELVPSAKTATVQDIINVYAKFGVAIDDIKDDPAAFGNALLNLATVLIQRKFGSASIATHVIHAAIQLALAGLRAEKK